MLTIDKSPSSLPEGSASFDLVMQNMPRPKPSAPQLPSKEELKSILPTRWSDAERAADYNLYRGAGDRISLDAFDAMFSSGASSGKKEDGTLDISDDEQGAFTNNQGKDFFDLISSTSNLDLSQNEASQGLSLIDKPPEFKREESKALDSFSVDRGASDNTVKSDRFEASLDGDGNANRIHVKSATQQKGEEGANRRSLAEELASLPTLENITSIPSLRTEDGKILGPFPVRFIGGALFELPDTHQNITARVDAESGELIFTSIKEE